MTVTPSLIDAILGLVVLEALGLSVFLIVSKRPRFIAPVLCFLASGAALMIALRAVLAGQGGDSLVLSGALAVSFFGHIGALALAWRARKA